MADKTIDAENQNVFQVNLYYFRQARSAEPTARAAQYSPPQPRHLRSIAES